jgi:hypothetical protein
MTLPWLPDGYHMRALQLIDRAPAPIVPPAPGVRLCDFAWCCAFADKKSGWPIEGPRRVSADDARNVPPSIRTGASCIGSVRTTGRARANTTSAGCTPLIDRRVGGMRHDGDRGLTPARRRG